MTKWTELSKKASKKEIFLQKALELIAELDKYECVHVADYEVHGSYVLVDLEVQEHYTPEFWNKLIEPILQYEPTFRPTKADKKDYTYYMHISFELEKTEYKDEDLFELKGGEDG